MCEERLKCVCVPKKKEKKTQVCVKKDSSVRVCIKKNSSDKMYSYTISNVLSLIFFVQITKGFNHSNDIKRSLGAISV